MLSIFRLAKGYIALLFIEAARWRVRPLERWAPIVDMYSQISELCERKAIFVLGPTENDRLLAKGHRATVAKSIVRDKHIASWMSALVLSDEQNLDSKTAALTPYQRLSLGSSFLQLVLSDHKASILTTSTSSIPQSFLIIIFQVVQIDDLTGRIRSCEAFHRR